MVKRKADGRAVYAVLKGNGYGLGMLQFAHELRDCGIERFAVTEPTDAIKLRLAGFIDEEILVMRSTADERDIADILEAKAVATRYLRVEAKAVATIGSYEAAVVLNGWRKSAARLWRRISKLIPVWDGTVSGERNG